MDAFLKVINVEGGFILFCRPPQNRTITVRKGDISAQNQEIICDVESPTDLAPRN